VNELQMGDSPPCITARRGVTPDSNSYPTIYGITSPATSVNLMSRQECKNVIPRSQTAVT